MTSTPSGDVALAAEKWLEQASFTDIEAATIQGQEHLSQLQAAMASDRKAIGPLIGKVRGRLGQLTSMESIDWFELNGGMLAVGHRPSKKKLTALKLQGATHLLTLLSESEGALSVKKAAQSEGMDCIWFAMGNGEPPAPARDEDARALFAELQSLLAKSQRIYIHCSAGIHRTGMITNALLRFLGFSQEHTDDALAALRQETSEGVGDHRKAWGARFQGD